MPERVSFYIDGYNLYFGLKDSPVPKNEWVWADLRALCESRLEGEQALEIIHYCTAPSSNSDSAARQAVYWQALQATGQIQIHAGIHKRVKRKCGACKRYYHGREEKKTDSMIATLMVADAMLDRTDTLVLISGDTDHVPPIEMIKRETDKRVVVLFPPMRGRNEELKSCADSHRLLKPRSVKRFQLPDEIRLADGSTIHRPTYWVQG